MPFSSEKFFSNYSLFWTSCYPDAAAAVIQMLCGLSYFSSLCLLILHSIFISAILILIFKSTFFSSECFSFGCVLFLFQSCMTLRKITTFLKFSFIFLPCLCLSWTPSLRVFVGVCVSHLEASSNIW